MNKTISIIIPYYKEKQRDIFPLLSSLNNQIGIDFEQIECILVNDGNHNILPEEFLSIFSNLNIRCLSLDENKGPGVARQVGIDNANGEYVMFSDADDVIHNVGVLGTFLQEIDASHPDIITSPWLEELYDETSKVYTYINHDNETTWMHGKLFRRLLLQTKNIRFHEELRVHEDSYFLALAFAATKNSRTAPFISYVWRFIPDSITRRNNKSYTYDSIPAFVETIDLAFQNIEKTSPQEMPYKIIQFIMYNYFTLHQRHWLLPEHESYLIQAEKAFGDMIAKYIHYYLDSAPDFINAIYNQERGKLFSNEVENESLNNWLKRLKIFAELA